MSCFLQALGEIVQRVGRGSKEGGEQDSSHCNGSHGPV